MDPALRRGWVKDSVGALFNREAAQFYMGNMMYVGEKERKKLEREQQPQIRHNTHEAIISPEMYERAMAARGQRFNAGNVFSPSNRVYLLGEGIAHCAHCGKPLRCVYGAKGPNGGHYLYYRCAAWLRDEPCSGSRQQIREDALAPQLDAYMAALQLPADWQQRVQDMLAQERDTDSLVKRRDDLRSQLRRLNYQFEHGLIEEADIPAYEKRAQRLIREINSIVISDSQQTIDLCKQAIAFTAIWGKADPRQRHIILKEIFDAIYVNTHTKEIVGLKPYIEFVPMFRQTRLVEKEGCFVLKNEEAAPDERLPVWDGSDGHRVFARREGYRARPLDSSNYQLANRRLCESHIDYRLRDYIIPRRTLYFVYRMRRPVWIRTASQIYHNHSPMA